MTFKKNLHWFLYPLFLLSCARQTAPTGGPKDTIPPHLIKAIPPKGQTNFRDNKLELLFDEAIAVNNPKEQIIITPDINKEYDATAKKNRVIVSLKKKLKDSTTYSFNFRDAVQDITEKNSAVNLKIAVSTGTYIDSLVIAGRAVDPVTNKELKDITIALYQSDTFNIFKHKPVYFTKSDQKGNYTLENLKPGYYKIYAIDDKNRNLVADSKSELYGFLSDSIYLTKNLKGTSIPLIKLDSRTLKLTNSRPYNTYYNIKLSKSLTRYKLTAPGEIIISSFGDDPANIKVYNTFNTKDSVAVKLHGLDSIANTIDTTLYIKFSERQVKPEAFNSKSDGFRVIINKGTIHGRILFNKPLLDIRYDSILYRVDTLNTITFSRENFQWDSLHNTLTIHKAFDKKIFVKPEQSKEQKAQQAKRKATPDIKSQAKKNINNELYFGKGAFVSIELDSTKQSSEQLKPLALEETGIIFTEIKTNQPNYIVQLLDKSFKIVQSSSNNQKSAFEDLSPGEYQIRLIIDINNDGKWTPGNFYKKEEPEPIRFYRNEKGNPFINLKANWEVGPLLITYP
ncbi:MAG TPA: Ig-like domain-containing protein [Ohtaekwangia sp.]|uniref:Ig-like domain-containing protein n=1 Tax=Ohtaekwangia sp. TaxID=2066019 RepID=UPI002F9505BA